MLKMAGWTAAVWILAFAGVYGWAVTAAFFALMHGSLVALAGLNRDKECHVCGNRFEVGQLGMCGGCANELRPVRR